MRQNLLNTFVVGNTMQISLTVEELIALSCEFQVLSISQLSLINFLTHLRFI